jgi:acetyl-CoA carboxylase carboxyltransferase component
VLRKGYGLGAMAMAGGGFHAPLATAAWPSGEFGAMGLEGAVKLGYRKELEALPEGEARERRYRDLVDAQYEKGKAINMAATLEIDAVIDPAQTRTWLAAGLASAQAGERQPGPVDSW